MGWMDEATRVDLGEVLQHLGIEVLRGGTAGPCPACNEGRRGSGDKRGALNVKGALWRCHRGSCGVGGDGLDAVSISLCAQRTASLGRDDRERVQRWYADRGWCEPPSDYRPPALKPAPPPVRQRDETEAAPAEPPPAAEVSAFWQATVGLWEAGDFPVVDYLTSRGFPVDEVVALGFPRVAPKVDLPPWWLGEWTDRDGERHRSWSDEFRLVWPAFDSVGRLRSVHGRRVPAYRDGVPVCEGCGAPLERTIPTVRGQTSPILGRTLTERCSCGWRPGRKTTWPARSGAGGMLFADRGGLAILKGKQEHRNVLVVEGVTDLLRAALVAPAAGCAVLGFTSGGARALGDIRWAPGTNLAVATDADPAGDKYADDVAAVVGIPTRRVKWIDL